MGIVADRLHDWTQGLVLAAGSDDLQLHASIVTALANTPDVTRAVDLVAYAHNIAVAPAAVAEYVRTTCQEASESWQGGDRLERVLAGAAVATMLAEGAGPAPTAAALASRAAEFIGAAPAVPELTALAASAALRAADDVRRATPTGSTARALFDAKQGDLPAEDASAVSSTALRNTVRNLRTAVRASVGDLERVVGDLVTANMRMSEELDLLWWTLQPFSVHLPGKWGTGPDPTLVASVEVFSRLRADPPARGVEGIVALALERAHVNASEVVAIDQLADSLTPALLAEPRLSSAHAWATPVISALQAGGQSATRVARLNWAVQLIHDLSLQRMVTA